ncbi:hypothetical protein DSO57_1014741 [Entomophthora muscae]|uniref:Uncharacterized protein n=2 Tax=Entomophthora muscae TaxID=34485 RepID=A0ACC2S7P0_9FUNG|nr:hypothetical protein DSO57_1013769 [Entomophthora muscae]KAJ9065906.1 hypothetical protein DSO57_1014741 [Entomophthora muscae]
MISPTELSTDVIEKYFAAISAGDNDTVRDLIASQRGLTQVKKRGAEYRYDPSYELDAYKFLGAYLGQLTGLHLALLLGHDSIARDILDVTFDQDLHQTFGDNNTTLHLAAFMENHEVVESLIARGADPSAKNGKGFTPLDVSAEEKISSLISKTK